MVFLRALVAKGQDKTLIALKGGCNLRFYFGSIRYSEDMDFDVGVMAKGTLKNKVERLLQSPIVLSPLKSQGIENYAEFQGTRWQADRHDSDAKWARASMATSSSYSLANEDRVLEA